MGESSFWYRPTRVVPDQRPLNGRRRRHSPGKGPLNGCVCVSHLELLHCWPSRKCVHTAGILILGLKAKFFVLGLVSVQPWPVVKVVMCSRGGSASEA